MPLAAFFARPHTRSDRYRDGVRHGDDPGRVGAVKRGLGYDALSFAQTEAPAEVRRLRRVATAWRCFPQRRFEPIAAVQHVTLLR